MYKETGYPTQITIPESVLKVAKEFQPYSKLETKVCRDALACLYFDNKEVVATNGHFLVRVSLLEPIFSEPVLLRFEKVKLDRSYTQTFDLISDKHSITPRYVSHNGTIAWIERGFQYPNYKQALPLDEPTHAMCFDVEYLRSIVEMIGDHKTEVILNFTPDKANNKYAPYSAMTVQTSLGFAVLMPCKVK